MNDRKAREIKARGSRKLSGLSRRYFMLQFALNYFIVLSVLVVILLSFIGIMRSDIIRNADENLMKKGEELSTEYPYYSRYYYSVDTGEYAYYMAYFDAAGKFVAKYGNVGEKPEGFFYILDDKIDKIYSANFGGDEYRVLQKKLNVKTDNEMLNFDGYTVKIMVNIGGNLSLLHSLALAAIIFFVVGALILLPLSAFTALLQIKPYDRAVKNSQMFTSNASHEINTPLAIIKTNLQNIMMQPDEKVSEVSKGIAVALSEIERLQNLTKQLLMLSRSDDRRMTFNYEPINFKATITEICEPYTLMAEEQEKGFKLTFANEFPAPIPADKAIITQIMVALLDNEIKYAGCFSDITVRCGLHGDDSYYISVSDNGEGVPDKELENIFMRFYRSDRSRNSPGSGLGLSIVHALVKSMNGQIIAGNLRPHGLRITVILPILKADNPKLLNP